MARRNAPKPERSVPIEKPERWPERYWQLWFDWHRPQYGGTDIKRKNSFNSYIPESRYNPNFPLLFKRTSFSIYWAGNLLAQPEECSSKYLRSTPGYIHFDIYHSLLLGSSWSSMISPCPTFFEIRLWNQFLILAISDLHVSMQSSLYTGCTKPKQVCFMIQLEKLSKFTQNFKTNDALILNCREKCTVEETVL